MKRLFLLAVIVLMGSVAVSAQSNNDWTETQIKEEVKARKAAAKMTKKEIEAKSLKDAKKQAKQLKKEGWKPAIGALPIEKQLTNYMLRTYEKSHGFPKYITVSLRATSGNYTTAQKAAEMRARVGVASKMGAEVTELAKDAHSNGEITTDVETVAKYMSESSQLVQQSIGRTETIVELYRERDGKTEVEIGLSYDGTRAKADILKAFENASAELREEMKQLLDK